MATGDKDPGKVDPTVRENFPNRDFLSPDESSPHKDEIIPEDENNSITFSPDGEDVEIVPDAGIVDSEPTTAYTIHTILDQLIVYQLQTTNLRELERRFPEIVGRYKTILTSDIFGRVVAKSRELKVFTVPTLIYALGLKLRKDRTYVYDIIADLESDELVISTDYKIKKPDPSAPGEPPQFYRYTDVELDPELKREDPALKQAQRDYEEVYYRGNSKARRRKELSEGNRHLLQTICTETVDNYKGRGRIGKEHRPEIREVKQYIREVYPNELPQFINQLDTFSQEITRILHYADRGPREGSSG